MVIQAIGFNDVTFVNLVISGRIIMWFFVVIAALALIIFLFNLVFIRPGTRGKKTVDPKSAKEKQVFEDEKNDVDIEVALILKVEEENQVELD